MNIISHILIHKRSNLIHQIYFLYIYKKLKLNFNDLLLTLRITFNKIRVKRIINKILYKNSNNKVVS